METATEVVGTTAVDGQGGLPAQTQGSVQAMERSKEVEASVILSRKFPRNAMTAYENLIKACQRKGFAEIAFYSYPRGGTTVSGASINLAKEAARLYGNIRFGIDLVSIDDENVHIQAWAWDMETNTRTSQDAKFKKLIFRKSKGWIVPDERDLRELINRHGSLTLRGCLLNILPKDFIDDAVERSRETRKSNTQSDPQGTLKRLVVSYSGIGVTAKMIEERLKHPLSECNVDEIEELREVYKSINEGHGKRDDFFQTSHPVNKINLDELQAASATEHQGHESTNTLKPDKDKGEGKITAEQTTAINGMIGSVKPKKQAEAVRHQLFEKFNIKATEALNSDQFDGACEWLEAWGAK